MAYQQKGGSMSEQLETLMGTIFRFIYHKNGFSICSVEDEKGNEVVVKGNVSEELLGETLVFHGKWIESSSYGRQFQFYFYEIRKYYSRDSVVYYFRKNVKGVGKQTANRIYDYFGHQTIRILNQDVHRIQEVPNINKMSKLLVEKFYVPASDKESDFSRLIGFGIGEEAAKKFQKKFGNDSADLLMENPYLLCQIDGISFRKADQIATRLHIEKSNPNRIAAGVHSTLKDAKLCGHTYLPRKDLIANASQRLDVSAETIIPVLKGIEKNNPSIYYKDGTYSDRETRNMEFQIAKKVVELSEANSPDFSYNLMNVKNIQLDDIQMGAVKKALKSSFTLITGGPGTGKTTLIRAIIASIDRVLLAAPTGKAAKRMEESTGVPACTIHRLLGVKKEGEELVYEYNEKNPISTNAVIIDETSMLDTEMMYHLVMAIPPGTKVIFAGDIDQLPSVGAGQCLNDMIQSKVVEVVHLTKIYRQGKDSSIPVNSKKINEGILPESETDFYISQKKTIEDIKKDTLSVIHYLTEKCKDTHPEFLQKELQVLCPMKKGEIGSLAFNKAIQEIMNPPSSGKKEIQYSDTIFREGDKVMHIKNDYSMEWKSKDDVGTGVFNGDTGIITEVNPKLRELTVSFFDGKEAVYDEDTFSELVLSYAITIHKSQGSEYKFVLMPMAECGVPGFLNRRLLYTGVTRARNRVRIIGSLKTIKNTIKLTKHDIRYTRLFDDLVSLSEQEMREIR